MATELAFVGIGSNQDNPCLQLTQAIDLLSRLPGASLLRVSSFYQTKPWGGIVQPEFLNAVAVMAVNVSPLSLMTSLLAIEIDMGRQRNNVRYGPRRIDLDLLLFGLRAFSYPTLQLPHPQMLTRAFVLAPLLEVANEMDGFPIELWRTYLCRVNAGDVVKLIAEPIPIQDKLNDK